MTMTLIKLRNAMERAIRRSINKPFGPITEEDTKQMHAFLANINNLSSDLFEITCDYTNNTVEDAKRGIINMNIKLKIAPEDRYSGF